MANLFKSLDLTSLLTTGVVLAAIIRVIWFIVSWLLSKFRLFLSTKKMTFDIVLGPYDERFESMSRRTKFFCLIVRYGTDQYIKDMASEQEKHDGRLQNKVIHLAIVKNRTNNAILKLQMSIHKRIGTQFKCFAQVYDKKEITSVQSALETWDQIKLDDVSEEFSQYSNRLFFLLKGFGKVETVEGFKTICVYQNKAA